MTGVVDEASVRTGRGDIAVGFRRRMLRSGEMGSRSSRAAGERRRIMMQDRPPPDNKVATATEESHKRLNSVAANLSGVIYRRIDHADGKISYPFVSDSIRLVYGYKPDEIVRNP